MTVLRVPLSFIDQKDRIERSHHSAEFSLE